LAPPIKKKRLKDLRIQQVLSFCQKLFLGNRLGNQTSIPIRILLGQKLIEAFVFSHARLYFFRSYNGHNPLIGYLPVEHRSLVTLKLVYYPFRIAHVSFIPGPFLRGPGFPWQEGVVGGLGLADRYIPCPRTHFFPFSLSWENCHI